MGSGSYRWANWGFDDKPKRELTLKWFVNKRKSRHNSVKSLSQLCEQLSDFKDERLSAIFRSSVKFGGKMWLAHRGVQAL